MGAELHHTYDIEGGGIWGAPFGRHVALWLFHFFHFYVSRLPSLERKIIKGWGAFSTV